MRSRKTFEIIGIACTYVGTVIGAGFASGQELLQFFVTYGGIGLAGVLTAGFLFALLGYKLLALSWEINATSLKEMLVYLCGEKFAMLMELIISLSLFGIYAVMLAGAGTLARDYFGVSFGNGMLFMAVLATLTVFCGVKGIVTANFIVTPLLAIVTIYTGVSSAIHHGFDTSIFYLPVNENSSPASHWILGCLLYVSYNVVFSASVLSPLGAKTHDPRTFAPACLLSGLVLAILAGLISATMMFHHPEVWDFETPMLNISIMQSDIHHTSYACSLLIAMYTSSIAALFSCTQKLSALSFLNRPLAIVLTVSAAMFISRFGFAKLIALIYPVFGYSSVIFVALLLWKSTLRKRT